MGWSTHDGASCFSIVLIKTALNWMLYKYHIVASIERDHFDSFHIYTVFFAGSVDEIAGVWGGGQI